MEKFNFDFSATLDPRKGYPYVARLVLENGKIARQFYKLQRQFARKQVTVFGQFEAGPGDIIEMRESASWKNDYTSVYVVSPEGKLVFIGMPKQNGSVMHLVWRYLRGELTIEELINSKK